MGGERERAEFAAFEALLSNCIADALVRQLRKEAEAHGVDVVTWLKRDKSTADRGACAPEHNIRWLRMSGFNRAGMPHCVLYWRAGVGRLCRTEPRSRSGAKSP